MKSYKKNIYVIILYLSFIVMLGGFILTGIDWNKYEVVTFTQGIGFGISTVGLLMCFIGMFYFLGKEA